MFCPTKDDLLPQALALLPRGRAWGDGGPRPGTVLHGFWSAVTEPFAFAAARLCALREEFWCATKIETADLWLEEYGLPDACDPFPDLCAKVAAIGGTRCEYFVAVAARIGWAVTCEEILDYCGAEAGCAEVDCAAAAGAGASVRSYFCGAEAGWADQVSSCGGEADSASASDGGPGLAGAGARILITVDLSSSSAFGGVAERQTYADLYEASMPIVCEPDISALVCVLERIVPAHVEVVYATIPVPIFLVADPETFLAPAASGSLFVTE